MFFLFLIFFLINESDSADFYLSSTLRLLDDLHIPRLGLGTAGLGSNNRKVVKNALEFDFRLIDTAQALEWYDESQIGLGISDFLISFPLPIFEFASNLFIVTKIHPRSFRYDIMKSMIESSKRKLYQWMDFPPSLDLVLIHAPWCWRGHCSKEEEAITWKTGWKNLESLKRTGEIKSIGVSNFGVDQLRELLSLNTEKVSVIQNWMDPFHQDRDVRDLARSKEIVYMAYSSLGTQWGGKRSANPVLTSPLLRDIAEKHRRSIPEVVISWILQEGAVALPRASSQDHLRQNAAAWVVQENATSVDVRVRVFLSNDDMETIRSLDGTIGEPWD